jgi:CheY-like chemotaxis protein
MGEKQRVTILTADDSETNRYIISRILSKAGFEVVGAATGLETLRLATQQPDLIVLDIHLPDMNGFDICRQLKADPETKSIPIIHLSASFVKSQDKVQGLDGGADGYLTQPVEPAELIATINSLLRLRRAEEAARVAAQQWQTTFDAICDGVCLLDREGEIL